MSNLLKQDTYYSEFGDSGAFYTYPSSVRFTLDGSSKVIIYSKINSSTIENNLGVSKTSYIKGIGPQNLDLSSSTGVLLSGTNIKNSSFFKVSLFDVSEGGMLAKDSDVSFVFADSEYKDVGKTQTLIGHSFVLTGD